jgi:ATP-dependent RNA helicase RhlE
MSFASLELSPHILKTLASEGYEKPTPIQAGAIPVVLAGRDLLGIAQTGTGKTAAFALPIIHKLSEHRPAPSPHKPAPHTPAHDPSLPHGGKYAPQGIHAPKVSHGARKIRALILSPTRELAGQIEQSFKTYGQGTTLRVAVVFGGVSAHWQIKALYHGVDVLVATPGRLLDLMNQGFVDLSHVQHFVLDEADQMMDMGFIHDIRKVVAKLPKQRQTLLFSATMPDGIRHLANDILHHPATVAVTPVASTVSTIDQSVYHVQKGDKPSLLVKYVSDNGITRMLVFTRTKHGADKVARHLDKAGIPAAALHANKTQGQRRRAMERFKSDAPPVLVATDIAARGLDIDAVSHVVNYDVPNVPETYVHRIGRTARAGASGNAVSFCSAEEQPFLRDIERLIKQKIRAVNAPSKAEAPAAAAPAHKPQQPQPARPHQQHRPAQHQPHRPKFGGFGTRRFGGGPRKGGGAGGGGHRHAAPHGRR